jgi:NAD(P)-dependent dehydrogenase (short-subunit alcohol dehydrogenase family)
MLLTGKTVLVTGGASGLGRATAESFLAKGAKVVLADRNVSAGQEAKAAMGDAALFVETDVTSPASMQTAIDAAVSTFGALHVVVGCAGVGTAARIIGKEGPQPLEKFAQVITVNLVGQFNALRLGAAAMAKNTPDENGERGVVISTASVAAFEGQVGQAAYSASKAGLVGLTLPAAREFAPLGIRVNTIAPGIFDTPMLAALPEAARQSLGQQVPFPSRLGRPSEYGALAVHICENTMVNGETIRLDGALRMGAR